MDNDTTINERFKWDLDRTLEALADDFIQSTDNPYLMDLFFLYKGEYLFKDKTLRELKIDPHKEKVEIEGQYMEDDYEEGLDL